MERDPSSPAVLEATPGVYAAEVRRLAAEPPGSPVFAWNPWLYRGEWAAWQAARRKLGVAEGAPLELRLRSARLPSSASRFLFDRGAYDRTLVALADVLLVAARLVGASVEARATLDDDGLALEGLGAKGAWRVSLRSGPGEELSVRAGDEERFVEVRLREGAAELWLRRGAERREHALPAGEEPRARFERAVREVVAGQAGGPATAGELADALQAAEDALNQGRFAPTRAPELAAAPRWNGLAWRRRHPPLLFLDRATYEAAWAGLRLDGARVLLVRAPNRDPVRFGQQIVLPFSTPSLAAFLTRHGAYVRQQDANALEAEPSGAPGPESDLVERLAEGAADGAWDLVGFSVDRPEDLPELRALTRALKPRLGAPFVVGGRGVSAGSLAGLPEVDYLVAEEGELPLLRLVHHVISGGAGLEAVPGLQWRTTAGIQGTPAVEHALDLRPLPDFADVLAQHRRAFPDAPLWFPYSYEQGCPLGCAYCSNFSDHRFQTHPPERVVADLARLQADYGATHVFFLDNLVNLRPGFLEALLTAWEAARLDLVWGDSARPGRFDPALFPRLAALGCRYLVWGIDAGSLRLQRLMGKNLDLAAAEDLFRQAHAAGIENRINLIGGLPHETEADLAETLALLTRLRPVISAVLLGRYDYAPSSPVFREPARYGLVKRGNTFDEVGGLPWAAKQRQIDDHVARLREHLRTLELTVT